MKTKAQIKRKLLHLDKKMVAAKTHEEFICYYNRSLQLQWVLSR